VKRAGVLMSRSFKVWDSDIIVRNSSMVDMYRIMAGLEGILLFLGLGMRAVALFSKPKNNRISNVTCH
jgi:hypothetical protein